MSSDAERVLVDLARTLDDLGVRWYLFGAQDDIMDALAELRRRVSR